MQHRVRSQLAVSSPSRSSITPSVRNQSTTAAILRPFQKNRVPPSVHIFYSNGGDDDDKAVQMWSKSAIGAIFNIDYWTSHQMLDDNSAQIILMAMMIITIMMTMIRSKVAIFSKGDKYKFNKGTLTMASGCGQKDIDPRAFTVLQKAKMKISSWIWII